MDKIYESKAWFSRDYAITSTMYINIYKYVKQIEMDEFARVLYVVLKLKKTCQTL